MEEARGQVPVIVDYAAPSTKEVVGWTKHAKNLGAAGVMALPPGYDALKNEIIAHYQAISNVGLPIVVYNSPRDTPTNLTPDFLE